MSHGCWYRTSDIGSNLNYQGWKGNHALISNKPNLWHLFYDVTVAAVRVLTWHKNLLCAKMVIKCCCMAPTTVVAWWQRQCRPLFVVHIHAAGEGGEWAMWAISTANSKEASISPMSTSVLCLSCCVNKTARLSRNWMKNVDGHSKQKSITISISKSESKLKCETSTENVRISSYVTVNLTETETAVSCYLRASSSCQHRPAVLSPPPCLFVWKAVTPGHACTMETTY